MKLRKTILITLILTLLLAISFSGASAFFNMKTFCFVNRGDYNEANKTCTWDAPWAEAFCLSIQESKTKFM